MCCWCLLSRISSYPFNDMATSNSTSSTSPNSSCTSKEKKAFVDSFAGAIKKKGIKMLALDFDKTLVEIHTRGLWTEDAGKLASHVRPCMKDLILAVSKIGVFISIVTYSSQAGLIRDLMHNLFPKKVASKIYVVANTAEFLARLEGDQLTGKEAHINSVNSSIEKDHKVVVKQNEVLLLDDDFDNVRKAASFGHYAFQVEQTVDYPSFESFETMLLL